MLLRIEAKTDLVEELWQKRLKEIKVHRKERKIGNIAPELADRCYTCGTCSGGCPATGLVPIEGGEGTWDARKAIRAIVFGMEQEVIDSKWPWVCTLCGRCQYQCPMGIQLMRTFRACRTLRARDKVPGPIHKGTMMNLERGNNLGIPKDDFLFLLADLGKEVENERPAPVSTCRWTRKGPTSSSPSTPRSPSASPTT